MVNSVCGRINFSVFASSYTLFSLSIDQENCIKEGVLGQESNLVMIIFLISKISPNFVVLLN